MRNPRFKAALSATLLVNLLAMPLLALADGGVIQLKPLHDNSSYTNTYSNTGTDYGNGYGNTGYSNNTNTGYNNSTSYSNTGSDSSYGSSNNNYGYDNTLRGRLVSIPKGTLLTVQMDHPVIASVSHVGDPITATLESDVYVNDAVAIPAGSQVLGQVANVSPPGHMGKHGEVDVQFDSVKLQDGRVVPVHAHIVTQDQTGVLKGDTYTKDVLKGTGIAAGATGVGTLMGTAAGGLLGSVGTGALFGLGVGALGGMGYAIARKGKDVTLPSGSRMSLMVDTPVTFNN
jgi:hypothetical protein